MNNPDASQLYATWVRPWLGELLTALRLDLAFGRADGNRLYYAVDGQERSVLDFLGGYGANFFGHYHPRLKARLIELIEAQVPIQAQGSIRTRPAELAMRLSQQLQRWTGREYVVTFTNSGAETVEAALKHAKLAYGERRQRFLAAFHQQSVRLLRLNADELPASWLPPLLQQGYQGPPRLREACAFMEAHNQRQLTRSPWLVAMQRAFHGKTTAAVQLTANPDYRRPFTGLGFETRFLAPDSLELERVLSEARAPVFAFTGDELELRPWSRIVACFAEPLQGEGGIHPLPAAFLEACRAAALAEGFPLILDEIQSGFGRTGSFVYSEQLGVAGDYYLLAKSLGGGLCKIGALLVRADQYCYRFGKLHSATFAEDELSAGVALEALDLLESEGLIEKAAETGAWLRAELEKLQLRFDEVIADVRGTGLMLGIEFRSQDQNASPAIRMLSQQQLLGYAITGYLLYEHGLRVAPTLSSPRTIRLEPAASIERTDCKRLLAGLEDVCQVLRKGNVYHLTRFLAGLEGSGTEIETVVQSPQIEPRNPALPQVAFVGHFIQAQDMALWDKGFALFEPAALERYLARVYRHLGPVFNQRLTVSSSTGAKVQLSFIGLCAASRQMNHALRQDPEPMVAQLEEALDLAVANG
ncbi:MAG TPA: aminotransferase class III-fold pyridoxal phosphate-dependent enzyme, partial [Candidatus Obscuribacterales bacterium]